MSHGGERVSRLDSAIRRLMAQRACLDAAAALIADLPGPVLELGLGNGRTYDHLREILPDRGIYVFDRRVAAHPECVPDDDHLFLGDVLKMLPRAAERLAGQVALVHSDIGSGRPEVDAPLAAALGEALAPLLRPGAIVVSDQRLAVVDWQDEALPKDVPAGRYFFYRAGTA